MRPHNLNMKVEALPSDESKDQEEECDQYNDVSYLALAVSGCIASAMIDIRQSRESGAKSRFRSGARGDRTVTQGDAVGWPDNATDFAAAWSMRPVSGGR